MKSVLISTQPKWCELIASGKKKVDVRKTKPKLETPFKVYINATKPSKKFDWGLCGDKWGIGVTALINYDLAQRLGLEILSGKVIGEFVCDKVEQGHILWVKEQPEYYDQVEEKTQLTYRQMFDYLGESGVGYFWHISNLVIYDKPRELSEFRTPCKMGEMLCGICDYAVHGMDGDLIDCNTSLERPPQSWCYVESEDTE